MATSQKTDIPAVPLRTPMFDGTKDNPDFFKLAGTLNRTWIIFFERIFSGRATASGGGPYHRTILIKNTTTGNDIADHLTVWGPEPATGPYTVVKITGVLRKAIASSLTLRINIVSSDLSSAVIGTFTIPASTPVNKVISFDVTALTTNQLSDQGVLTWDILASDASKDGAGVGSFTIEWQ